MDTCKLSESAITLIRCPVCLENFSKSLPPITLQCGHNLCRDCISRLKRRQIFLKCPLDNQNNKISAQAVNLDFLELIENAAISQKRPREQSEQTDAAIQCDFSDIMQSWEQSYEQTLERVQALEKKLETMRHQYLGPPKTIQWVSLPWSIYLTPKY